MPNRGIGLLIFLEKIGATQTHVEPRSQPNPHVTIQTKETEAHKATEGFKYNAIDEGYVFARHSLPWQSNPQQSLPDSTTATTRRGLNWCARLFYRPGTRPRVQTLKYHHCFTKPHIPSSTGGFLFPPVLLASGTPPTDAVYILRTERIDRFNAIDEFDSLRCIQFKTMIFGSIQTKWLCKVNEIYP